MVQELTSGVEITFESSARIDDIIQVVKLYYEAGRRVGVRSIGETPDRDFEGFYSDSLRLELRRLREKDVHITVLLMAIAGEHEEELIDIAQIFNSPHSTARVRLNGRDVTVPELNLTFIDKIRLSIASLSLVSRPAKFPDAMAPIPRSMS